MDIWPMMTNHSAQGALLRNWHGEIVHGFMLGGMEYPVWFVKEVDQGWILASDNSDFIGESPLPFVGPDGGDKVVFLDNWYELDSDEKTAYSGDWIVKDSKGELSIVPEQMFNKYYTIISRGDT